jgi:hypothetical protein
MIKTALTIAAISLISSATAMAREPVTAKACAADVKAQCASVKPGEGRVGACVKEHFKDLSAPCQRTLFKAGVAVKKACSADAKQFCAGVKPGGDRLAMCMQPHLADLSQPCKAALAQVAVGKK